MTEPTSAQTLIVGGGVLGCAIADELATRAHDVVLVDAQEPGHPEAASGDTTRVIRSGYGNNGTYTSRAWQAHSDWRALGDRVGENLLLPTGALWLASGNGAFEEDTYQELSRQGIPVQRLNPGEISKLYPSINTADISFGVFEPEAGVLRARRGVQVLAESAIRRGARVVQGTALPTTTGVEIDGEPFRAENVVWAAGAWLPAMFPGIIQATVTSQDVVFVRAEDPSWNVESIPAWIDPSSTRYGIGAEQGRFKVASSALGLEFNPWEGRPKTNEATVASALNYAAHRFPSLAPTELSHLHPCQYTSTGDTQFILAQHPEQSRWWFAGGDSGHAFKHALWVARHLADRMDGTPAEPAFGLGPRDSARGLRVSSND